MTLPSEESLMVCRDYMLEHWVPENSAKFLTFVEYCSGSILDLDDAFRKYLPNYQVNKMGIPRFTKKQVAIIDQFVPGLIWVSNRDYETTKDAALVNWID